MSSGCAASAGEEEEGGGGGDVRDGERGRVSVCVRLV